MNDLIPLAVFALCLLATFGFVRVCEWLRPSDPTAPSPGSGRETSSTHRAEASR